MSCVSCGSNFCGCGTSSIAIPVVKGDKGDTGATGATGAQGPAGVGAANAVKKYVRSFAYDGTIPTITITRAVLEDNAYLSQYAYSVADGAIIGTIFGVGCHILNLKIYVTSPNDASLFYDISRWMEPTDVEYSTTGIVVNFSAIANRIIGAPPFNFTGNITFWIVIIG